MYKQKEVKIKKTNKLLLELECQIHDLHVYINKEHINITYLLGKINYINSIGEAIKVKHQMNLEKHARRV